MKIEMGESLIYSWLRHEKQCQLVQTNWKPSNYWDRENDVELHTLADEFRKHYDNRGYNIFKERTLEQILKQAEIDVIGISFSESAHSIFAVDIAYHEAGLQYGTKKKTLSKIIQKCVRTALCLYGYFNIAVGEIIFASPKVNPAVEKELIPLFEELTCLVKDLGLEFTVSLCCNDAFFSKILRPIDIKETNIADTSELFLRSVQLYKMFVSSPLPPITPKQPIVINGTQPATLTRGANDGKAVQKIPLWATRPDQNNHKIIRAYFQIQNENGKVDRPSLIARCQDVQGHPDVYVQDFAGNFASMKTDKGNSHGKVFTDDGYNIGIWNVVNAVLQQHRNKFL